jgi:hypothetical protein
MATTPTIWMTVAASQTSITPDDSSQFQPAQAKMTNTASATNN